MGLVRSAVVVINTLILPDLFEFLNFKQPDKLD